MHKLILMTAGLMALMVGGCGTLQDQAAAHAQKQCGFYSGAEYEKCFHQIYQADYNRRARAQGALMGVMADYPATGPQYTNCTTTPDGRTSCREY